VEVLHGAEAHFPEVEEVVGEKEDLASKAFKNQRSFYHARKHCVPPQNYFFSRLLQTNKKGRRLDKSRHDDAAL
jgi:hypothetical protein